MVEDSFLDGLLEEASEARQNRAKISAQGLAFLITEARNANDADTLNLLFDLIEGLFESVNEAGDELDAKLGI